MASKTSLDEKISDLVGSTKYKLNENVSLNYNFSLDQNYNQLNYTIVLFDILIYYKLKL